jgi:hypothetical protein
MDSRKRLSVIPESGRGKRVMNLLNPNSLRVHFLESAAKNPSIGGIKQIQRSFVGRRGGDLLRMTVRRVFHQSARIPPTTVQRLPVGSFGGHPKGWPYTLDEKCLPRKQQNTLLQWTGSPQGSRFCGTRGIARSGVSLGSRGLLLAVPGSFIAITRPGSGDLSLLVLAHDDVVTLGRVDMNLQHVATECSRAELGAAHG